MMDPAVATYGEENRLWTGDEARAFARVGAIPALLAMRAADRADSGKDADMVRDHAGPARPDRLLDPERARSPPK